MHGQNNIGPRYDFANRSRDQSIFKRSAAAWDARWDASPPPSLPDARPGSDRFRCGGRESDFLAVIATQTSNPRRSHPLPRGSRIGLLAYLSRQVPSEFGPQFVREWLMTSLYQDYCWRSAGNTSAHRKKSRSGGVRGSQAGIVTIAPFHQM